MRQGLIGSLILTAFVAVLAIPLGIAAAVYLQEYARDTRLNRLLIANIRNLAGVPSIVFGILGLVVFVADAAGGHRARRARARATSRAGSRSRSW